MTDLLDHALVTDLTEALYRVVYRVCYVKRDHHRIWMHRLDSQSNVDYANAIRLLARVGRVHLLEDRGRIVTAECETHKEQVVNLKYRKKPVVVEAFQMTEERRTRVTEWPEWMRAAWNQERETPGSLYPTEEGTCFGTLSIGTLEGQLLVSWGDWIIRGVKGELYPCADDIFRMTYEEVVIDVSCGDWITRDVKGEIDSCKSDIFEATYEPA